MCNQGTECDEMENGEEGRKGSIGRRGEPNIGRMEKDGDIVERGPRDKLSAYVCNYH